MSIINHPYMALLIIAVIISAGLAVATLKFRPTLGTRSFATLSTSVALWAFVALFEVGSLDPATKSFSYHLKYVFVVIVPVAWFTFSLYYANRLRELSAKTLLMLTALPAVTLAMVATNNYHQLMFTATHWHPTDPLLLLQRNFGPWFWIHAVYCYLLLFLGVVFLAKALIDSPALYRSQVISLLVGGLTPWICNIFFVFDLPPLQRLDTTPLAFTVSGIAFMWGILRHRLLEITPMARDVVVQNMRDAAIVLDLSHRIVDLNLAATRLLDRPQKALIGFPAESHIAWWRSKFQSNGRLENTPARATFEQHDNGRPHLFQATLTPIVIGGRLMGYLLLVQDITTAQMAEDALRNSEARFRSLTENAPVIIFALDTNGHIAYTNPALTKILGYLPAEVLGRPFHALVEDDPANPHKEQFQKVIEGHAQVVEINLAFLHKDGSKRLFNANAAVNSDSEGRVTGIIGMAKDITAERSLQHQFCQSQKMEAIGTLAGGIAHDFNNLLMGMQANISLLRIESGTAAPLIDKLNRIEDQIQSGASLTRQLLGYARKGKYVVTTINLNQLIAETLSVVRRANKKITTELQLTTEPAHVEADRSQLELVLLNLFVNAVDAMPKGGTLRVSTRIINDSSVSGWSQLKPGAYIETSIADSGIGMDPTTLDHIFEPFFTTKAMGQGTGLGLASVYGVVQNHGGHIRVESQPGKGSVFYLLFPLSARIITQSHHSEKTVALPPGEYCVMLVDDEPLVLKSCGDMIESLGFGVVMAQTGKEAVAIYEKQTGTIDLVILDMVMPEMDGLATFEALKAINADVAVILATGYTRDERVEKALADGCRYLRKPYTRNQLAESMTDLLTASYNSRECVN